MTKKQIKTTKEINEFFVENRSGYSAFPTNEDEIGIEVTWGDWKHEHGYADYLVKHFFMEKGLGVEIDVDVTRDDGSDTYSAIHYYELNDIYFSGRVISESTSNESSEGFQKEFYSRNSRSVAASIIQQFHTGN